jgi:Uma2 family endonuclease
LGGLDRGLVVGTIISLLGQYILANKLGVIVCGKTGFVLERKPDTVLAPDVAFIRTERVARVASEGFGEGPPDLVIEVRSFSKSVREITDRAQDWLSFAARVVWIVYPRQAREDNPQNLILTQRRHRVHRQRASYRTPRGQHSRERQSQ